MLRCSRVLSAASIPSRPTWSPTLPFHRLYACAGTCRKSTARVGRKLSESFKVDVAKVDVGWASPFPFSTLVAAGWCTGFSTPPAALQILVAHIQLISQQDSGNSRERVGEIRDERDAPCIRSNHHLRPERVKGPGVAASIRCD